MPYLRFLNKIIFIGLLFVFFSTLPKIFAQSPTDTLPTLNKNKTNRAISVHKVIWGQDSLWPRPRRATIASLILPGLGQFYNKSYWKIPIVYAGLGTCIYFIVDNHYKYKDYQQAYLYRTDNDSTTIDKYVGRYTNENTLRINRDFSKRNRDFFIILGAIGYGLTAIEAYVDAHLKYFDVSEKLSIRFNPLIPSITTLGIVSLQTGVTLRIK